MPYKNDNLEELFQKAASDYPLRTDNSNWDSVSLELNNPVTNSVAGKNKSVFKYAALLLFLLGGSLILYKLQIKNSSINSKEKITNAVSKKKSVQTLSSTASPINPAQIANNKTDLTLKSFNPVKRKYASAIEGNNYKEGNLKKENNNAELQNNLQLNPNINTSLQNTEQSSKLNSLPAAGKNANVVNNQNVITNTSNSATSKNTKQVIKLQQVSSKFYGSLYAAPEFSVIKFQHISKPGYKIGVALGYRINNRFDVELGVQREHIHFYTDGEYFDKSALRLKGSASLESVNGSSKLTSVPITIKYNFSLKSKGHFFTSAGANVVLLTHTENYEYVVSKNGVENDLNRSFGSVTSPKYFTYINTSAGYETKLFNQCNIKIEPYYQIPLSTLGIGKLPVTSFGVNIGIVKDLK